MSTSPIRKIVKNLLLIVPLLGGTWVLAQRIGPAPPLPPPTPPEIDHTLWSLPVLDNGEATEEAGLFLLARQPASAQNEMELAKKWSFRGVFRTNGTKKALLETAGGFKLHAPGETLPDGAIIAEILADALVIKRGKEKETIKLYDNWALSPIPTDDNRSGKKAKRKSEQKEEEEQSDSSPRAKAAGNRVKRTVAAPAANQPKKGSPRGQKEH